MFHPSFVIAQEENPRDGSYLDIGLGWKYDSDPFLYDEENGTGLTLFANGRYQKYGFFVEFPRGTTKQQSTVLSLGYNFLNTDNWSYDLQLAMNHRDLDHLLPETKRNSRRVSHSKLGLRVLGDIYNTHVKFIIAGASGDPDGGIYASAWASKSYDYFNWHFYGSFGAEFRNEDVVNYFYAINNVEGLPYYRGKKGIEYTAQLGASYPLTESWIFESFIRTTLLPSGISNSPLVDEKTFIESALVIKYVF